MQHGDMIPVGTTLEVEKRLADQWKGSKIARAATDEEVAEYQGDVAEAEALLDDVDALAGQKRVLEVDIEKLQERKTELAGDLQALESDVADLGKQKETLGAEVKALEAAKAAAEKPVAAAKPK
jgi:chromosome segregation ATPase